MKYCQFCGAEVNDESVFCESCGKNLTDNADDEKKEPSAEKRCKTCGHILLQTLNKCPNCGAKSWQLIPARAVKCRYCGHDVARTAKRCLGCGRKNKRPFYYRWWFRAAAVIFAIGLAVSGNDSETGDKSTASRPAEPTAQEIVVTEDEYKAQCAAAAYNELARNPNSYTGQTITFRGKVIQVAESGDNVDLRINVTRGQYGLWDDTIYVDYKRRDENESRILENDMVTIYGEFKGIKKYIAILGNQISIPHINAEYIDIG